MAHICFKFQDILHDESCDYISPPSFEQLLEHLDIDNIHIIITEKKHGQFAIHTTYDKRYQW